MNGKNVGAAAAVLLTGAVAVQNLKDDCYRYTGLGQKGYVLVVECVSHGKKPRPASLEIVGEPEQVSWQFKNMEQFGPGDPDGFECACDTGQGVCEFLRPSINGKPEWVPAPRGVTLSKDSWRGAGCFRKSCVELWRDGATSWPTSECPGG